MRLQNNFKIFNVGDVVKVQRHSVVLSRIRIKVQLNQIVLSYKQLRAFVRVCYWRMMKIKHYQYTKEQTIS